jgi:dTDP-4-dehydrorhamnose 3,5-epimerase
MPFNFKSLSIPDVILIEPFIFRDERGAFAEMYKLSDFKKLGILDNFVQDNYSISGKWVLRGLHYQIAPAAQGKLVRVARGRIFDVAVDIRKDSHYFGKWIGVELSEDNRYMLWIPAGFAHGFVALEDNTEVLYKTTEEYAPEFERGIIWNDPEIGIEWPVKNPVLSPKDANFPFLADSDNNF